MCYYCNSKNTLTVDSGLELEFKRFIFYQFLIQILGFKMCVKLKNKILNF